MTGFGNYRDPPALRSIMVLDNALCALPENRWLPWMQAKPPARNLSTMVELCHRCPEIVPCELLYRRVVADSLKMAPGVWAGKYRAH